MARHGKRMLHADSDLMVYFTQFKISNVTRCCNTRIDCACFGMIALLVVCRVIVAGFSQGGALALQMLHCKTKLAGIAGMSTWLIAMANELPSDLVNKQTPIWMAHSADDDVVRDIEWKRVAESVLAC
jgi:Phospholipase/Carboxylesterase